ncbi:MAG: T9SS type A sorting domain-containing protein [Bacteroidales bacterium]|nr:T9SS type A sorting domain-containing protein [Bacteroidales bacterium]
MRKFIVFFLALFFVLPLCFADGYKVLFIGNSYTQVNNLPQVIAALAESTGDTLFYDSNTPGGYTFRNHLNNATTNAMIKEGGWDYVVLQGQSQEPSFPDSQFMSQTYPYAKQLCELVRQYNPSANVVFYMTWGRKNGDSDNCPVFPPLCTYEGMDSLLYLRYMTMARDFDSQVSPVGALWHYLRDNHPEIELYASDGSHPSLAGTYAAACSFYAILFHKNPLLINNDYTLSSDVSNKIRIAAERVVYDSLAKWFVNIPTNINTISRTPVIQLFPNPASNNITFVADFIPTNISVYNMLGQLSFSYDDVQSKEMNLDISFLKNGMYLMQIIDNKQNKYFYKFVKKYN